MRIRATALVATCLACASGQSNTPLESLPSSAADAGIVASAPDGGVSQTADAGTAQTADGGATATDAGSSAGAPPADAGLPVFADDCTDSGADASVPAMACAPTPPGLTVDHYTWETAAPFGLSLQSAWSVSADDAWFAPKVVAAGVVSFLHWDGTAFALVPTPLTGHAPDTAAFTADFWGPSGHDLWAAVVQPQSLGVSIFSVLRFDGTSWRVHWQQTANVTNARVHGNDSNDVWVVSIHPNSSGSGDVVVMHWDGTAWSAPQILDWIAGTDAAHFLLTTRPGMADINLSYSYWYYTHGPLYDLRAFHWDGRSWALSYPDPPSNPTFDWKGFWNKGVMALSRWDGASWKHVTDAVPPAGHAITLPLDDREGGAWSLALRSEGWDYDDRTLARWDGAGWTGKLGAYGLMDLAGGGGAIWGYGTNGAIARLDTGGWKRRSRAVKAAASQFAGASANGLWALTKANEILTRSGGSWRLVLAPKNPISMICLAGNVEAWAFGGGGIAMRWDGSSWSTVAIPSPNDITACWASAPNDVWASDNAKVFHWDGASWSNVPGPDLQYQQISSISGTGPNDVWLVSMVQLFHYDGKAWSPVASAPAGVGFVTVNATAPGDVWAVSYRSLHHFDGTTWTQADLPGPTSAFWAQPGRALAGGGIDRPWVARWDGKSWTLLDAPIDAAPSALWGDAAGRFWLSSGRSILHYAP